MKRGDRVKLKGIITRVINKNGAYDVLVIGSVRKASVRIGKKCVKKKWGRK